MPDTIKIAVADDSPLFLDGLLLILSTQERIVITGKAANGKELVDVVSSSKPDVVITDIQMPVMNGVEATRLIKQKFPSIAVIALTTFGQDALIMVMLEAGASGYILKNTPAEHVIKAVHTVHSGENYFCQSTSAHLARILAGKKRLTKPEMTAGLSEKEIQIIKLICEQYNTKEIASSLTLSPKTIDGYRQRIMEKLEVNSNVGIVIYAMKAGLYKP